MAQFGTAVVTGAGGFIGSHLVEALARDGVKVRAYVRYNSRNDIGLLRLLPRECLSSVDIVRGNVLDVESVQQVVRGADVVFHLAALVGIPYSFLNPREVVEVNVIGSLNVLTAAREAGVGKIIQTSTSEVYGTAQYVPMDEMHPLQAQSPYAASKIAADAIALSFARSFSLPVAIIRPFNTYGPRQSARAIIPTLIAQAFTQETIKVGATTPTRDFTFVTDTIQAFIRVAEVSACVGEVINVGSGHEISIGDLIQRIMTIVGREVPVEVDPQRLRPEASEVRQLLADTAKARHFLSWAPEVSLDEGLRRTADWVSRSLKEFEPGRYSI